MDEGGFVCGCAGAFLIPGQGQVHRNPACSWFNVYKRDGKWVGVVRARGVRLRTSGHAEAWRAAVELEWLLDRWCREHGACRSVLWAVCSAWHFACGRVAQELYGASW
jgi:hypothetical protein